MWSFEEITFGQDIVATILIFISWENQAANPVDLVSDLVQLWCNWVGKDIQFPRPIRSQTLFPLSYGCGIIIFLSQMHFSRFQAPFIQFSENGMSLFGQVFPAFDLRCNCGALKSLGAIKSCGRETSVVISSITEAAFS